MKILDQKKIEYKHYQYDTDNTLSGLAVANLRNLIPNQVFKTLVTIGTSKKNYVFVVPVTKELDLKKAAKAVNEKKIEMIKSKDLLPLTGYMHGGCSPIGMKKFYETFIDSSALNFETIYMSAGKIGYQLEISLENLSKVIKFKLFELV